MIPMQDAPLSNAAVPTETVVTAALAPIEPAVAHPAEGV